jgi:hypothetical protein
MWNGVVLLVVSPKENGGREGAVVKGVKWDGGKREREREVEEGGGWGNGFRGGI